MDSIIQDLRYAARLLRRAFGSTAVAIVTLALATGLSTSIFTLVNAISLRPLPYEAPEELVQLNSSHQSTETFSNVSAPDALSWRASRTLRELAIYDERTFGVRVGDAAEEVVGNRATGNLLSMLGVQPLFGRLLTADDEQAAAARVVVISHLLWQARFAGERNVLGRVLVIDGVAHEVVGVMPNGFGFHDFAQFWIPLRVTELGERGSRTFTVMARRKAEFTDAQVAQDINRINETLAAEYAATNRGWRTNATALESTRREPFIYGMVVAALLVLLIACANVGNLLLARGAARRGELAVRSMMGASRRRVLRQLLTESTLLAVVAGVLGLIASFWGIDLLVHSLPLEQMPLWIDFSLDRRIIGYTTAGMLLSVLTFGLAPALSILRDGALVAASDAGRRTVGGRATTRTRNALVIAQLALSLVLLSTAGLFLRGTTTTAQASPGFDPDPVLHMRVPLSAGRYASAAARAAYVQQALQQLRSIGNVASASVTAGLPATLLPPGSTPITGLVSAPDANREQDVFHTVVSPEFFTTLQLPVLRGRAFTESDVGNVVMLSQSVAERLWPGADPIGRSIKFGEADNAAPWQVVIGVVGNRYRIAVGEGGNPRMASYDAYAPARRGTHSELSFLIRARDGQPLSLVRDARAALQRVDRDQPIADVRTYADLVYDNVRVLRWMGALAGTFALSALCLSAIGLFGVIAYSVTQRTREIGIRVAVGARPDQVVRMVTRTGTRLVLVGLALGMLGTLAIGRLLAAVLFGVSPYNPLVLGTVALVLGSVAVAASWLPARRAASVNPLIALRAE